MKKLIFLSITTALFLIVSCGEKKKAVEAEKEKTPAVTESKQEKNKKIAIASVNAFISGNVDDALKYVAPDAVDYGDGSHPPVKGIDSIKAALKTWRSALSVYKGNNVWALADGENVAVVGEWTGTFKTDFMGMKTAGKTFTIRDVDLFKFNDEGKIIEHRSIQSPSTMISQLGVNAEAK
jgi:predicted ester cyclase